MNPVIRLGLAAGFVGGIAACSVIDPISPAVQSGAAQFGVYVALGTSLGAGYSNGGLVRHHQMRSYTALFARQAGAAAFTIPSIGDSGIPQLLVLRSYAPLLITRAATPGAPLNSAQLSSYHNLSIPGALLVDVIDSTLYGRSPLFAIIQRGRGTLLQQAIGLSPTFVSFEFGANEVLSAATQGSGTLVNPAFQPPQFAAMYTIAMNGLAAGAPNAELALFNVPDVTSIPFFTTFPPITLCNGAPTPLLHGPNADPLGPNDLVLLSAGAALAAGTGFPVGCTSYVSGAPGNGNGLGESLVLDASEQASIQGVITAYNAIIDSVATNRGAALVDLNALLNQVANVGIRNGGQVYTDDFITGGTFSLDGVHPTDLGYGIMANAMVDAVNARFGATLPRVDLGAVATRGRYRIQPSTGVPRVKPRVVGLDGVIRDLYGGLGTPIP